MKHEPSGISPSYRDVLYLPGLEPNLGEKTNLNSYLIFLQTLAFSRIKKGLVAILVGFSSLRIAVKRMRFFIVRKLLWGRGRLSRPLSHASLVGLGSAVILVAPLLNTPTTFAEGNGIEVSDAFSKPVTTITEGVRGYARSEKIGHTVTAGDTLSSIGEKYKVSVSSLCASNNLSDCDNLRVGTILQIPPIEDGVIVEVKKGDSVEKLAERYKVDPQLIVDANYLFKPFNLEVGSELIVPGATIPKPSAPAAPSTPAVSSVLASQGEFIGGSGRFIWPTSNRTVSQGYHSYHPAVDIPRPKSGPIYAIDSGRVVRAGWWPVGFGIAVQIDHGDGYLSSYCHLSRVAVSVGDYVEQGQVIGTMGATGRAYGQHVHFMIQHNGKFLNPMIFY